MITINRYILALIIVPIAVGFLSLIAITVIISSSNEHIYDDVKTVPKAHTALLLGAGILRSGNLSPVLKDRADQTIELYQAGKVEQVIASGKGQAEGYNEVVPVKRYLMEHGIPEDAIIMDHGGFDTYSSIYRARDLFEVSSLAIVSQSFHLPRAVFIARKLGIEAVGVSADRGHYKLTNYFREMAADVKAIINLASDRKPATLSESPSDAQGIEAHWLMPLW